MHKRYLVFVFIFAFAFFFSLVLGYVAAQEMNLTKDIIKDSTLPVQSDQNEKNESSSNNADPIQDQIKKMSMEEKVGQLVMAGIDGFENDDHSTKLIEKYHVGGFVLLKQNIRDAKQMLALVNSLKDTNSTNKIPLFLSIDEEGGRISRMPPEFVKIPASKKIGDLNNSDLSYQVGSILGQEVKSFGLNMDFAPVLDINSNPKNPVIGDRAFGDNASLVTKLGIQTLKGLQSQNIISVVKHFPGHGDTSVDSHIGLPTVSNDIKRLKNVELVPFSAAIKNKVDAVMIAHILFPNIDPVNPASFSKTIISDILRKDLKFDGVAITDDLTMGAIVNNYDIGKVAVKAINAGTDIVLVCHDYDKEEAVIKSIREAVEKGDISSDRLDQSVYRILKLKQKYTITDQKVESVQPQEINNQISQLQKKVS